MSDLANWTALVARLSEHGEVTADGATDTYTVLVPDTTARLAISDISGMPALDDAHPSDASLHVVGYRLAEHGPGELFRRVSVVYEADGDAENTGGEEPEEIGLLTALDYPAYTQSGDLVCDQLSGAPVLNSAGDVFDSVPQIESVWAGVHFVRRVKTFPAAALALAGTLNSAAVTVYGVAFAPRTARLRATARHTFDGSRRPYELDVTIEPRHTYLDNRSQLLPNGVAAAMGYATVAGRGIDIGWDVGLLECGYQYLDPSTHEKVRFTVLDENGNPSAPQLPQKLNAKGGPGYTGDAILVVRIAAGNPWTALQLESSAPS